MLSSKKWMLSSTRYVEDILYDTFKESPSELAVHSWIIDTRDKAVKEAFTSEEWKRILETIPKLPDNDTEFISWLSTFGVVSFSVSS